MAKLKGGTDFQLIERIFNQLSSSVSIALLKDEKLAYEFYGGRKAASPAVAGGSRGRTAGAAGSGGGFGAVGGGIIRAGRGLIGLGIGKGSKSAEGSDDKGGGKGGGKGAGSAKDADGRYAGYNVAAGSGKNDGRQDEPAINRTTRFNIGSASAMFTGALIIKLMEFGEVGLNDAVVRFIPEFPFKDITVYHLLTHTSGLTSENIALPDNYTAMRDFYRKLYEKLGRAFKPGAKSEHYVYGYAILADIVGRASSQMLEELASVLIFMPLGMKYTTYNSAALRDSQYVIPWNHKENRFMGELHAKHPTGHSGLYTTALDLIRFGRLFLSGGEYDGKQVFLESSVDFLLREITDSRFMRTPLFMIKRQVDIFGCFSEKLSPEAVALTGDTGSILFIDPARRIVGAALTNSTWVHSVSRNYSNIVDILTSI